MSDCFSIPGREKKKKSSDSDSLGTIIDYYWRMFPPLAMFVYKSGINKAVWYRPMTTVTLKLTTEYKMDDSNHVCTNERDGRSKETGWQL